MQTFSETQTEVIGSWFVWYKDGAEVDAFRTANAAEATVRRVLRAGWSNDWCVDADGSVLFLGLKTGHVILREVRDALTGLEIENA